jgi:hypothetical protein
MTTPCQVMAAAYSRDTGEPTYQNVTDRETWLYSNDYGYMENGEFKSGTAPDRTLYANLAKPVSKEEGFVPYVNERGFQCINKITGHIQEKDENGMTKNPGLNQAFTQEDCVLQCYQTKGTSDSCFDCISKSQFLSRCPFKESDPSDIKDVLKNAVQCTSIISDTDLSPDQVFKAIDRPFNEESVPTIYIVLASVGGFMIILFLILLYVYEWKHRKKNVLNSV